MQITSAKNPLLQDLRRAASSGKPTPDGLIVAEGPRLLEEALNSSWSVVQIFVSPGARERYADLLQRADCDLIEVSGPALAAVSGTESSQEIIATLQPRQWNWNDLAGDRALVVALDGIQDPGNAGTIVRSAEAFGATGVVFLDGSVRVSNAKFIRATAGSIFRMPFVERVTSASLLEYVLEVGLKLYALTAGGHIALMEADFRSPCVLAVGSEGGGISPELQAACNTVFIPTVKIESLNAAIASSIALFEADRQRRLL